jgi:multisubunit Na+/H+ antiporter MnhB subunit
MASVAVGVALWQAIGVRSVPTVSLPALVRDAVPGSGVSHDITAVLLNFRSYDTLLEIAVLLAAAVVALALRDTPRVRTPTHQSYLILDTFVWRITPLLVLVAAYLLWAGSTRPGGAFQAGSVLAGAAVLLRLSGVAVLSVDDRLSSRLIVVFGLSVFLLVAAGTLLAGQPLLTYPPAWAGALILMIEAALTLSIAVVLFSLFDNAPQTRPAAAVRAQRGET